MRIETAIARNRRGHFSAAAAVAAITLAGVASAGVRTWTGLGGDANWTTTGNWGGATLVSLDSLIFTGSTSTINNNNTTVNNRYSITFDSNAAAFTLNGNAIALSAISNNSGHLQTVNLPFTLSAGTITIAGNEGITFGGTWTNSSGGRTVTNNLSAGTLTFTSADLNSQGLTVNGSGNTSIGTITNTLLGGGASITYTGSGTLTLTGTCDNSPGKIAVTGSGSGGTMQFARQVSLYAGTTSKWTATNITVSSGATAAFNVGGDGEFTAANIDTLKALGTATAGFKSGSFLGLDTSSGDFAYNSAIANTFSGANVIGLTKLGSNTLTLTGNSSYTGGTNINKGAVVVGNASALGTTGTITVQNGATLAIDQGTTFSRAVTWSAGSVLGGKGTYSGTVSGAAVAPGLPPLSPALYSVGTLTVAGDLSLAGTSVFDLDSLLSANDQVILAGSSGLTMGGDLKIVNAGGLQTGSYLLFDLNGGTINGSFASITVPGGSGTISQSGGDVYLNVTIPEPTALALLSAGTAGMLLLQRRRMA